MDRHLRDVFENPPCDLYHEPNILPLPCDRPTVATLHDLSALHHPEWHPRERIEEYERLLPPALARCVHFLAGSEFTRQELIGILGIAPERVTRVYHGIRPGLRPLSQAEVAPVLRRLGLPPRYLLHVGTIEPRKNLAMLLRAYCALPAEVRARTPLLLVGSWGWNAEGVADYLHAEARHRGVVHVGYIPERYLAAVYGGARALVYPTFYEGFGLPPLEMFACGRPVLASTAGALVETLGGLAFHIDPEDTDGWHRALQAAAEDDGWCEHLCRGVEAVARPFTWERSAAETWSVYRRVGGTSALRQAA
jgi:alpha-1,3-rhamnosyl/mannosyltransferase